MKFIVSIAGFAATLFCTGAYAQSGIAGGGPGDTTIRVNSQYSSEIDDLKDLLRLENTEYQKIAFTSPSLVGRNYSIKALEIWYGEVRDSTLLTNSSNQKPLTDSVFEMRVISKIDEQRNISMQLAMPEAAASKRFATMSNKTTLYSLRNVVKESKEPVVLNKPFYLMAYILPIPMPDKPGWLSYCNVDDSGEDVRAWGKELGIPHYIVFEMTFF
ncbi:MAG TPA: hypothetical protein VNQ55_02850 [Parapedobacter sp.]|nr:hypothetical protein [Parapedobacter sp.]